MPYMRTRTLERIIALRTQALEERLREAERRISNADVSAGDLERRLARTETDNGRVAAKVETQDHRLTTVRDQLEGAHDDLRHETVRRFAIVEELMSAMTFRSAEDQRQMTAAFEDLERRLDKRDASVDSAMATLRKAIEEVPAQSETKAELRAVANELARLSIDLRADVARALEKIRPGAEPVVDLTGAPATNGAHP